MGRGVLFGGATVALPMQPSHSTFGLMSTAAAMYNAERNDVHATQRLDSGQQLRGTTFQIGNLPGPRSLSAKAQFAATAKLLRQASASGNVNEIQAALQSVSALQLPPGVPVSTEVQQLVVQLRQQVSEDKDLARLDSLRRSRGLKQQVRRLWDVMISESELASAVVEDPAEHHSQPRSGEVSRDGYRSLHKRIAKSLVEEGSFSAEEANSIADQDWEDDVARFSGTNHITVWLDEIRNKFKAAAAQSVALHGFKKLFARYDIDGSGELDMTEFFAAVRVDLGIGTDIMTDDELVSLFRQVDTDGGGEVDANEFVRWLFYETGAVPSQEDASLAGSRFSKGSKASRRKRGRAQRVATAQAAAATQRLKRKFKEASSGMTEELGWDLVFEQYDDDGSGELELAEFATALRQECGLSEDVVSDEEISELFGVIDADQSGAIDSKELKVLLTADLDTPSMTFAAFYASMFELVYLWAEQETEEQYILFMQGLFDWITDPANGHEAGEEGLAELPFFSEPLRDQPERDTSAAALCETHGTSIATAPRVANFKVRSLEEIMSMVGEDGRLLLPGFISSVLDNEDDTSQGSISAGLASVESSRDGRDDKDLHNAAAFASAVVSDDHIATLGKFDRLTSTASPVEAAAIEAAIKAAAAEAARQSAESTKSFQMDDPCDACNVPDGGGDGTGSCVADQAQFVGSTDCTTKSARFSQFHERSDFGKDRYVVADDVSNLKATGVETPSFGSCEPAQPSSDDRATELRSRSVNNITLAPFVERTIAWSESANLFNANDIESTTRQQTYDIVKRRTAAGFQQHKRLMPWFSRVDIPKGLQQVGPAECPAPKPRVSPKVKRLSTLKYDRPLAPDPVLEATIIKSGASPLGEAKEGSLPVSRLECQTDSLNAQRRRRLDRTLQHETRGGLTYVVPARRRTRALRRNTLSCLDLGRDFDVVVATRSKCKLSLVRSCDAVESNMWPQERCETVEAVLLRRRAIGVHKIYQDIADEAARRNAQHASGGTN